MKFHYDLAQSEPIIRDYAVGGTSDILQGAVVARDGAITTALNRFCIQNAAAAVVDDVVGVAAEFYDYSAHISNTGANAATAAATGITNYIKVIINPLAVWLCEYSQHADDDSAETAGSATGKTITSTFTTDREGDWLYVYSGTGAGNLFQIGASNSTTDVTAVTSFDDYLNAVAIGDLFICPQMPFQPLAAGGSLDLSAVAGRAGTMIKAPGAAGTGAIMSLQNYISAKNIPMEPLRVERHSGINFGSCKLYADAFLLDHLLLGGAVANKPQIA